LKERWRSLSEDRRDDVINHVVVFTFLAVVLVAGAIVFLSIWASHPGWGILGALALMVAFGVAGFQVAESRGRSPWGWALICFLLPCLGLALLLWIPRGRRDL
jgi:hypothetical protein